MSQPFGSSNGQGVGTYGPNGALAVPGVLVDTGAGNVNVNAGATTSIADPGNLQAPNEGVWILRIAFWFGVTSAAGSSMKINIGGVDIGPQFAINAGQPISISNVFMQVQASARALVPTGSVDVRVHNLGANSISVLGHSQAQWIFVRSDGTP